MRWINSLRLRVRSLLRGRQMDRELDEELQYHLEHIVDDLVAGGMSPPEARAAARREMGAIEQRKEECRDMRGVALIESLRQDLGYAIRALRKSPGFSVVAIASLAIAIGANTTIFSFVNAILLKPLPYPAPDRLVVLQERVAGASEALSVHPAAFLEWRARAGAFESLALAQSPPLNVMGPDGAEQVSRLLATPDIFRVFGIEPIVGRGFTDDDSRSGGPPVVVLGHGFWRRWFGGDPAVVGRQLTLPEGSMTIVGVAPAGFRIGSMEPEVFTPLAIDPANPGAAGSRAFECYGRLKPGVTLDSARAEMTAIAAGLNRGSGPDAAMGVRVSSLHDFLVRDVRPGLRLLMAVVATTLAIACVNLAGLLLARGIGRRTEFAVRAALGASRQRLARQLAIENLVLAACGGVTGLLIAAWATPALAVLGAGSLITRPSEPVRLDAACLLFTFVVSTATTLLFGMAPARQASRADPQSALRERTHGAASDRHHHRARAALVTTQVALAVVLLVGAGLLLRTLLTLGRVDPGFQPAGTVTMGLFLGTRPPAARIATVDQILDRVESVPGVQAAGTIQFLPLSGMTCGTGFWLEEDSSARNPATALSTECALVSRGYFAAMGVPMRAGRPFDRGDRVGSARVVVVSESFARRYFPEGRALGRHVLVQASNQALAEIVGIVGDVRHSGLRSEPAPTVYLLHAQTPGYITNLVVRTAADPMAYAAAIRAAIHEAEPAQAVSNLRPFERDVAAVLARPRLYALLVACFAAIAMALAAIGIYGLIAYMVGRRSHEIGIRLALGATRQRVFVELLTEGGRLVVTGVVVGLAAAFALRQAVSTMVFGVTAADPSTYLLAALAFSIVALAAITIPARRASLVDPTLALRSE